MSTSITELVKNRIFNDMLRTIPNSWKVLVTDQYSVKILSAACKLYDVMDENVTCKNDDNNNNVQVVEDIGKRRQPYPTQQAIYFLTPIQDSVNRLIQDLKMKMYAGYHLFFTAGLGSSLFDAISRHPQRNLVKNLIELYVDFIAVESRVFSMDRSLSFYHFFSPESREFGAEIDFVAEKLVSVFSTLGENPLIRYHASSTAPDNLSKRLANRTLEFMERFVRQQGSESLGDRPRSIFLIVDRSVDVSAPLLHEFTYQAMAHDLINIENSKYKYKVNQQEKEVLLDESDQLWNGMRHMHIAEAINALIGNFNKFASENKAAVNRGVANLKEMRETINALPQFQELKGKECMGEFERLGLSKIASVEQDMSTGSTADGDPVKNVVVDLVPLLASCSNNDKVRLLMLYIISREGVNESDRKKLLDHAKIPPDDINAITNLNYLGVRLSKKKEQKKQKKVSKRRDDDVPYELSRYIPIIKNILTELANNNLDSTEFPFVDAHQQENNNSSAKKGVVTSLRGAKPSWQSSKTPAALPSQRIILFVAGGVTYSELRSAYEVANALKKDILIGGTHVLTPCGFVESLREIKKI